MDDNLQIGKSLSKKIIRNTAFNIIGKFWGILVSFGLTPYIIHHIGIERFGIWAIIGVITGYFSLFDFGIGSSFVKYIAEFYTKKDYEKLNQVINTGFIFYSIFAILIISASFLVIHPLLIFLKIPAHLYKEALFVFLLGIILFYIFNALSVFDAIPAGLQRMDITNKVEIAISIPNIAGTIFFLEKGYGLPGLMINNAIILVISSIINISISFRILPQLRFNPWLSRKEMLMMLFGFGSKVQITKVALLVNNTIVKLLTSHFLNLSLVGFYELGQKVVMLMRDNLVLCISAIMPAASEIEAKKDWNMIRQLYIKVSKYFNGIAIPLMTFIFVAAPLIILAWMGREYKISVLVVRLIIPGHLINILTVVGGFIAYGVGKPGITARALVITAILNLITSAVLIIKMGFVGVVIGTSVSLAMGSLIFINIFNKYLESSAYLYIKKTVLRPMIASLIAALSVWLLNRYLGLYYLTLNKMINLGLLGLDWVIFMCIYVIIILKTNYFDINERGDIKKILNTLILTRYV